MFDPELDGGTAGERIVIPEGPIDIPLELPVLAARVPYLLPCTRRWNTLHRRKSVAVLDALADDPVHRLVGVFNQCVPNEIEPNPNGLHRIGCLAKVEKVLVDDERVRILITGITRIELLDITSTEPYLLGEVCDPLDPEILGQGPTFGELKPRALTFVDRMQELGMPADARALLAPLPDAGLFTDVLASLMIGNMMATLSYREIQSLLDAIDIGSRLARLDAIIARHNATYDWT